MHIIILDFLKMLFYLVLAAWEWRVVLRLSHPYLAKVNSSQPES